MQIVFYLINPWNFCPVFKWQIFSLNSGSLFLIFFKPLNLNLYHSNRAFMPGNGMAFESQTFRSPVEILLSESRACLEVEWLLYLPSKTQRYRFLLHICGRNTLSLDCAILFFLQFSSLGFIVNPHITDIYGKHAKSSLQGSLS